MAKIKAKAKKPKAKAELTPEAVSAWFETHMSAEEAAAIMALANAAMDRFEGQEDEDEDQDDEDQEQDEDQDDEDEDQDDEEDEDDEDDEEQDEDEEDDDEDDEDDEDADEDDEDEEEDEDDEDDDLLARGKKKATAKKSKKKDEDEDEDQDDEDEEEDEEQDDEDEEDEDEEEDEEGITYDTVVSAQMLKATIKDLKKTDPKDVVGELAEFGFKASSAHAKNPDKWNRVVKAYAAAAALLEMKPKAFQKFLDENEIEPSYGRTRADDKKKIIAVGAVLAAMDKNS